MAKKSPSALEILMEDHDYVKKAYRRFQKLDPEDDREEAQALVKNVCAALKVHTAIEERIVYPAARRALKDKDLLEEAEIEHASAKILIRQLERMKPKDPKYAATFTVLCDAARAAQSPGPRQEAPRRQNPPRMPAKSGVRSDPSLSELQGLTFPPKSCSKARISSGSHGFLRK